MSQLCLQMQLTRESALLYTREIKRTNMQRLRNSFKHRVHHFIKERQDIECYLPFIRLIHSSLFSIVDITTLYEKIESCHYSRVSLYILEGNCISSCEADP